MPVILSVFLSVVLSIIWFSVILINFQQTRGYSFVLVSWNWVNQPIFWRAENLQAGLSKFSAEGPRVSHDVVFWRRRSYFVSALLSAFFVVLYGT